MQSILSRASRTLRPIIAAVSVVALLAVVATPGYAASPMGGAGGGGSEPIIAPPGYFHQFHRLFGLAKKVCKTENEHEGIATKQWERYEAYREAVQKELEAEGVLPDVAPYVDWFTTDGFENQRGKILRDGCTGVGAPIKPSAVAGPSGPATQCNYCS